MLDKLVSFSAFIGYGYIVYALLCFFGQTEDRLDDIMEIERRDLTLAQKILYIICHLLQPLFFFLLVFTIAPAIIYGVNTLIRKRMVEHYENENAHLKLQNQILQSKLDSCRYWEDYE